MIQINVPRRLRISKILCRDRQHLKAVCQRDGIPLSTCKYYILARRNSYTVYYDNTQLAQEISDCISFLELYPLSLAEYFS